MVFPKQPIFKSVLPESQMIGMYDGVEFKLRTKEVLKSTLIHFEDQLVTYGYESYDHRAYKDISLEADELHYINNVGLIYYKKDSKEIKLICAPLDLRRADAEVVLYNSNNFLNKVVVAHINGVHHFLICDEAKYLKVGVIDEEEGEKCKYLI